MNKKRVLLTGSGGMVGKNLLEHPEVSQFEMLTPSSDELNLRDSRAVYSYLKRLQPEMVIHAAGKVGGIQANMREPVSFLVDNLDMGRNIVLNAQQLGIKQLINLGSSCMYPRGYSEPLTEDMVLKGELEPTNEGYAIAKITTARLCDYVRCEDDSYQYKTIIPCNLYGRFDKFSPDNSHLIPAIIDKVHKAKMSGNTSVEIWGDGKARREFMYAGDLADALVRAMVNFETLPTYMNVGLGHDFTINEYYQSVADVMEYKGDFIHNLSKPVGMARKLVSVDRQITWGWSAKSDLRTGIEKTYEFYLKEYLQ
jgi:GDP-L-fucose synthase